MRKLIIPATLALLGVILLASGATWAMRAAGGPAGLSGNSYPVELNVQDDVCGHDPFIFGPTNQPPHNMKLTILAGTFISIQGPPPWVKVVTQQFPGPGAQFTATASATVAGFPNVHIEFTGTVTDTTITGKYSFGSDSQPVGGGGLPPCDDDQNPDTPPRPHAAVYGVKPKETTPTRTATRTPTSTPPQKLYSIIVLKLNNASNQPLAGWKFNLFAGANCNGTPLLSQTTNPQGLTDFLNLAPGTYSVLEKAQAGWNVVGEPCQNVQVPQGGVAGAPACPIQPDADFPQPGCDTFSSGGRVIVEINATQQQFPVTLNGPTQIERLNTPHKVNGFDRVDTEMIFMELTGSSPLGTIIVTESGSRESLGAITEQANSGPNEMSFPANSFFDVFFEVDIQQLDMTLHNEEPLHVECKIDQVPPVLCFYQPPIGDPIDLVDGSGVKIAKIIHALHIPLPPNETLVVFTNQPKTTGTPTSTRTATRTPTPGEAPTATLTPRPTNPPPNGVCTKTGQDVPFAGAVWDAAWKCVPDPASFRFDRIDIFVGTATQDPRKLDPQNPPRFQCQSTSQIVIGVFKGHKKNVNPGTTLPHHEVWSADFDGKCQNGVNVYLQTTNPDNHAVIKAVAFTNSSGQVTPTATATPTRTPTPTPHKACGDVNDDGRVNSIDANLVLQLDVGRIAQLLNLASADTNRDGRVNSIDATLVLQKDAGLLPALQCG